MQVSTTQVSTMQVSTMQVSTTQVSTMQVSTTQVSTTQVSTTQVSTTQVSFHAAFFFIHPFFVKIKHFSQFISRHVLSLTFNLVHNLNPARVQNADDVINRSVLGQRIDATNNVRDIFKRYPMMRIVKCLFRHDARSFMFFWQNIRVACLRKFSRQSRQFFNHPDFNSFHCSISFIF
jgi:hypothetical protein